MVMRLPRISQKRPAGKIIERAVREVLGPQSGHMALFQHQTSAQLAGLPQPANVTNTIAIGDTQDISGLFVWGLSAIDGGDAYA